MRPGPRGFSCRRQHRAAGAARPRGSGRAGTAENRVTGSQAAARPRSRPAPEADPGCAVRTSEVRNVCPSPCLTLCGALGPSLTASCCRPLPSASQREVEGARRHGQAGGGWRDLQESPQAWSPGQALTGELGPPARRSCGSYSASVSPQRLPGRTRIAAQLWTFPLWAPGQGRTRRSVPRPKHGPGRPFPGLQGRTGSEERVRDPLSQEEGGWTDSGSSARPQAASADAQGDLSAGLPGRHTAMRGTERRPGDGTASAGAGQDVRQCLGVAGSRLGFQPPHPSSHGGS